MLVRTDAVEHGGKWFALLTDAQTGAELFFGSTEHETREDAVGQANAIALVNGHVVGPGP